MSRNHLTSRPIQILTILISLCILFSIPTAVAGPVNYDLDHSDPASDVEWTYPNGTTELHDGPKDFNMKRLISKDDGDKVVITVEIVSPGKIRMEENATYTVLIATINNTTADLSIEFNNGKCTVLNVSDSKELTNTGVTCKVVETSKKKPEEALEYTVPKSLFNEPLVFEVAAKSKYWEDLDEIGNVTYGDYVWELSGNPGSTPKDPTEPGGGGSGDGFNYVGALVAVIAVIAILAIALIYFEHRKKR